MRSVVLLVVFVNLLRAVGASDSEEETDQQLWLNWGNGLTNSRAALKERDINIDTVARLAVLWQYATNYSVSATPTVDEDMVYFPDWAGYLYALDRCTGALVWKKAVQEYIPNGTDWEGGPVVSRTSPVLVGKHLYICSRGGSWLIKLNKSDGSMVWKIQLDSLFVPGWPYDVSGITMSPTYYDGHVFVGISSNEEAVAYAMSNNYTCCYFQGKFMSVNVAGSEPFIEWIFHVLPSNGGQPGLYSGGAVWGSSPSIDRSRDLVFIATGNNYGLPPDVEDCFVRVSQGDLPTSTVCDAADNYQDSIVALEVRTGSVRWAYKASHYDTYTIDCGVEGLFPPNNRCPKIPGNDTDFAQAPMFLAGRYVSGKGVSDVVAASQKSSVFYVLEAATGELLWEQETGSGGVVDAVWGSTADRYQVYTPSANAQHANSTIEESEGGEDGELNLQQVNVSTGYWNAMDIATGRIVWQRADPNPSSLYLREKVAGALTLVACGEGSSYNSSASIIFGGSAAITGTMVALDSRSGDVLWRFDANNTVMGGPSVSRGIVFWGTGPDKVSPDNAPGLRPRAPPMQSLAAALNTTMLPTYVFAFTVDGNLPAICQKSTTRRLLSNVQK